MYEAMQTVRAADNAPLVFVWQPVSAAGAIVRFGPEEYGGNGDLSVKVHALEALDEKIRYEESEKVWLSLLVYYDLSFNSCADLQQNQQRSDLNAGLTTHV